MRFFMKQKVFSWRSEFTIKDEQGIDRYYVQGEYFSWGHRLHLYAPGGVEVAYLEQKLWSFLPKYRVFLAGSLVAEVVQEFTWLKQRYNVHGPNWQVEGDFLAHEYEFFSPFGPVARISKAWFTWGDSYCIDVANPADELLAICITLTIDCCLADSAAANNTIHT